MPAHQQRSRLRLGLGWLGWWVALLAMWVALMDTTDAVALGVGALAAAIAATAARLVDALGLVALPVRPAWLAGLWRPVVQIVPETAALTLALVRRLAGRDVRGALVELSFRGGEDATERALMVKLAGSLAPGGYVVRIDEGAGRMVVHTLPAAQDPRRAVDPLGLS